MSRTIVSTLFIAVAATCCLAAGISSETRVVIDPANYPVHVGSPVGGAAKHDTLYVYGGPGSLEGKFEDANGAPDRQGWTSVDLTLQTNEWHVDTFGGDFVDGAAPDNHVWWCGEMIPACDVHDTDGGYGNNWDEALQWTGVVANNEIATELTVTFDLAYDSENEYDFLKLGVITGTQMFVEIESWTGTDTVQAVSVGLTVDPAWYVDDSGDEIDLRFVFTSDGAWSDEDCYAPSSGGARLDNIAVFLDGVPQGEVEDCEGVVPAQWTAWVPQNVGDFAKVWPRLGDLDPCRHNNTPVFAFIDDGQVVPGTGGYPCQTWCYSGTGYSVNVEGGLAGPELHIQNEIISPVIDWPAGTWDEAVFRFDVFRHFDYYPNFGGLFYDWHFRSTADPAGESGWSNWGNHGFLFYGGPEWYTQTGVLTDLLEEDATALQVKLGVYEYGWLWGINGTDAVPAPYYDNVAVMAVEHDAPRISMAEIRMAQDAFPAAGTLDLVNLESNSIRFDMARNISPDQDLRNDPGDSIIARVTAIREGATLLGMPRLYYRFRQNPVFDAVRAPEFAAAGYVEGYLADGANDDFAFDLPDSGWFFPGDVIHYYVWAQDDADGDIGTTIVPGDTTGFSSFVGWPAYDTAFTVRGLPTVYDDGLELTTPPMLLWDDGGADGELEWHWALESLGFAAGLDYDTYYTNAPGVGVGNGLGGRAAAAQLAGYETILYSSGRQDEFTITNADYDYDAGDDVGLLDAWLRQGGKSMLLTGDGIVGDMGQNYPEIEAFVTDWMGVARIDDEIGELIDEQSTPTVRADAGNGVFADGTEWIAYGACPDFRFFDAVGTAGTGQRLAQFLDATGGATYAYTAATLNEVAAHTATIISLPYDLAAIYTPAKAPTPSAARTVLLEKILLYFGRVGQGLMDVPEVAAPEIRVFPNPLNPSTRLSWRLPAAGRMTIDIFDLRGGLVRTLVDDEAVEAIGSRQWNGTNDTGARVASGVYFARVRSGDFTRTVKVSVVK